MKYTDNAINIITIKETKAYKGIGRAWIHRNLTGNESAEKIVSVINNNSKQVSPVTVQDFESHKTKILSQIKKLGNACDGIVALGDHDFPKYRGSVKASEQPIFLFYKGDLSLLRSENHNITVIGLLNPDESIETRERKIVSEIVRNEIAVVSGLALGCDSIAHKQALEGGKTIAILPSSLYDIMPTKNKELAKEIIDKGGLLISEYFVEHRSAMELFSRYLERDRLQALFSDAVILAASYAQDSAERWDLHGQKLDSGARHAMGFAKNYNILRAVMYDLSTDQNNPMFDLNRQLISEQGDITVLTQKSLKELVNKVLSKENATVIQTELFD